MQIENLSDKRIFVEIGGRIRRERLNRNITQADLALKAGISSRALQNLETGRPGTIALLIRVLRALEKLDALNYFLPEPGISPIQLAKLRGHERVRAGGRRRRMKEGE